MASVTNKENRALRSQSQQQQQGAFGADGSGAKLKPFQKTVETSPRDHSAANLQQLATPADSSPSMPANQAGSRTTRRSSRKGDPSAAAAVPPTSPDAANVSTVSPDSTSPPQSVPLPESPAAADNAIGICDARANNSGSGLLNASSPPAQDLTAWAETSFAQLSIDDCAVDESEHEVFFGIVSQKEIELASKVAARRRSLRGSKPETLPLAPPTTTLDATETPSSAEQVATPMVLCESQSSAPGICTAPQIASPAKVGDAEAKESLASAPRSPTRILNAADTLGVDIAATPSRSSVAHELGNASQQQQQQYKKFSNSQTPTKFSANRNPTSALSLLSSTPTKGRSTPSNKPMVQASTKGAFGISTPSRVVVTPMKSSAAAARVPLSPAPLARAGPSSPTVATRPQSSAAACRPAEPNIAPSLAVAPKAAAQVWRLACAVPAILSPNLRRPRLPPSHIRVRASMQTDAIASSCTQTLHTHASGRRSAGRYPK
ncbi:hypothetical protein CAOG_01834 [Capsaspora owczarzaki ATCC 30864]|uniref:hypothetical protein n=1 Tax=Capsaspora owczarzaki (strain ATCC 30864) TaxID=595528 RepID=UPI00035219D6|nr:hypothetical protein CAOG_01834 [Capsaspora owczarzaki ATCC 30864]|eukprot:XP_004364702.2 hypothetical protein CAOG_01834 [Capsaspora owczarzaki ATCC 30864]